MAASRPRHYFDFAAATPVDPAVRRISARAEREYGNPSALHREGQRAQALVDAVREEVAAATAADFREVVLTASATEANNLALRGVVAALRAPAARRRPRVIISGVEHESVRETAQALARIGAALTVLPVGRTGVTDPAALERSLAPDVALVSVMAVNNETGAVQPIAALARAIVAFRARHGIPPGRPPLFHADAAQALVATPFSFAASGADLATLSGHKAYGPRGAAALLVRQGTSIAPLLAGGGQEHGLRSGTENVPALAGFAAAVRIAARAHRKDAARFAALGREFLVRITRAGVRYEINGPRDAYEGKEGAEALFRARRALRAPHILNIHLPGYPAERLLVVLDRAGFAVSSGSACRSRSLEPSAVIRAMGYGERRARESLRISFGRPTTGAAVRALAQAIARAAR
jgi:cysteine desulfurase